MKSAAGRISRLEGVRTAPAAACPGDSRQPVTRNSSSLERQRTHVVVGNPGTAGDRPSAFEHRAASLQVSQTCAPVRSGKAPLFRTHLGQELAAMRPKERSCRKNWLSPRPPTNAGARFSKKVS